MIALFAAALTYSLTGISLLTDASIFTGKPSYVAIHRDGSKELMVITAQGARIPTRVLIDFDAHKYYTMTDTSCSAGKYASDRAPVNTDPVTGSEVLRVFFTAGRKPISETAQTLHGMAAKLQELPGPPKAEGRDPWSARKLWLADEGGYLLKIEAVDAEGKTVTVLEVKRLSFARPPARLFALPKDCPSDNSDWNDASSDFKPK